MSTYILCMQRMQTNSKMATEDDVYDVVLASSIVIVQVHASTAAFHNVRRRYTTSRVV